MSVDPRAITNPLFGPNRLKLGVFALNSEINVMTTVPEKFVPTWMNSVEVAQIADASRYEALVPYARWTSWGPDAHHYTARAFENFTWAAGIAGKTNYACVMSTVQVMTMHPLLAAKAMATRMALKPSPIKLLRNSTSPFTAEDAVVMNSHIVSPFRLYLRLVVSLGR